MQSLSCTPDWLPGNSDANAKSVLGGPGTRTKYTHDSNGAVTADGLVSYSYDTRGRLIQTVSGSGTTDYKVNSVGQRIRKTDSSADTIYHFDSQGRLIAESSASGTLQREYVYLGDMPVGVLDSGGTLSFIHVDHLNTPRLLTNSVGQPVWKWDNNDPFGGNPPDENPSGLGAFIFDLRFPGQVWNNETQTAYNYFRDCYDPATGRYCQPDPLGIRGLATAQGNIPGFQEFAASWASTRLAPGVTAAPVVPGIPQVVMEQPSVASVGLLTSSLNLYAYVANNPLSFIDPLGLELSPNLKGEAGGSILNFLMSKGIKEASKSLGTAIGQGLQGKVGQQGCRDACTEKCLMILNRATVYFRNEMLFGCMEGCIPKCNECP